MRAADLWIEQTIGLPAEQPDAWTVNCYRIGEREIWLAMPREPDRLLDDPAVLEASRQYDYMPYWAYVWPGALLLAEKILTTCWPAGLRAVEIGCGVGLAGLAALSAGLRVTLTDYSPAALTLATHNARLNGFSEFQTKLLDWRSPTSECYDVVLGADVLYEPRCLSEVMHVVDCVLASDGVALLSDPYRAVADRFVGLAERRGFAVECQAVVASSPRQRCCAGRIFQVRRHSGPRGRNCLERPSSA